MGRILRLLAAMLLFSLSGAAQGPAGLGSEPHTSLNPWQFAMGYQYNAINLMGQPFPTNGANFTLARFFGAWFAPEVQLGVGFGGTGSTTDPPNLTAKSLSVVGGARLAYRSHHIEPWIHGDVGLQYFRFNQTAGILGSNSTLLLQGGAGLDFPLASTVAIRTEADFLGTRYFSLDQRHFQVIGGLVVNF